MYSLFIGQPLIWAAFTARAEVVREWRGALMAGDADGFDDETAEGTYQLNA